MSQHTVVGTSVTRKKDDCERKTLHSACCLYSAVFSLCKGSMTQEFSAAGFFVNPFPRVYTMGGHFKFLRQFFFAFFIGLPFFDEGSSTLSTLFKALMDASLYLFLKNM
jgi:hypothetical protein